MRTKELLAFITERHSIYLERHAGISWPWTEDPILQQYRFCNVYRNLDKETQLIHDNWLRKLKRNEDLWFACVVARLVNWWPTLSTLKLPVPWDPLDFVTFMDKRKAAGQKVFTGAYMVRADAVVSGSKAAYLADYVLTPLWHDRDKVRPHKGDTLETFHQRLMQYRDMGSFMAAQVVADAKYFDAHLLKSKDWHTWAASGPGSRRGLNRVMGLTPNDHWSEAAWRAQFAALHEKMCSLIENEEMQYVTGQDLQNCLCEFDKYERVRLGEGKPRSRYTPPQPTGDN